MQLPADLTIRAATPADAESLTHLHLDVWDDAYTGLIDQAILRARRTNIAERVERWRGNLASGNTLLAESGGDLIGFASAGAGRDQPGLELYALYVRGTYWRTGVGRALMLEAVGDQDAHLWLLEGNDRARVFYERQGFRLDGTIEDAPEGRHVRMVRQAKELP
jgi:GNAT superfamily N-acetyltransferase